MARTVGRQIHISLADESGRSRLGRYRKMGFAEEGRRPGHARRANGELWDLIEMGLAL